MNAVSLLREMKTMGAREFRHGLDKMLRHPTQVCRVMLHNKPALVVLPDVDFFQILEVIEEIKGSGLWNKTIQKLQKESKKKHLWFWSKEWHKKEGVVDREIKAGRVRRASSVEEFLKELKE